MHPDNGLLSRPHAHDHRSRHRSSAAFDARWWINSRGSINRYCFLSPISRGMKEFFGPLASIALSETRPTVGVSGAEFFDARVEPAQVVGIDRDSSIRKLVVGSARQSFLYQNPAALPE